jgi:chemotaxis protein histidine kinase CheA
MIELEDLAVLLYTIPYADETFSKNKKILKTFCKKWSKKVKIPFVEKIVVTGMEIEQKEVPVSLDTVVEIAKKQKRKHSKEDWVMVDAEDAVEPIGSPKAKKLKESVDSLNKVPDSKENVSPKKEIKSPKKETVSPKKDVRSSKNDSVTPKKDIKESTKKETASPKKDARSPKKAKVEETITTETKTAEESVASNISPKKSKKASPKQEVTETPTLVVTNELTFEPKTSPKKTKKSAKAESVEEVAAATEEQDQIKQKPLTAGQKKKAKKLKKAQSLPAIITETAPEIEIESPTDPAEKKSVSWGPKHIKRI